jgi:hypothetical protein
MDTKMAMKYSKVGIRNQIAMKYTKILHPNSVQNVPKLSFWYENVPSGNPGDKGSEEVSCCCSSSCQNLISKLIARR